MKILAVVVAMDGFRDPAANKDRIVTGKALVAMARRAGARLVVLPAGYLVAARHSVAAVKNSAEPLLSEAERLGIALVLGIDSGVGPPNGSKRSQLSKGDSDYRYWVMSTNFSGMRFEPWEQRAVYSGSTISGDAERRFIEVGGKTRQLTVLACGEAFQRDLRAATEAAGGIAVNPCHTARGARYSNALTWACEAGIGLVRSVHAVNPSSVKAGMDGDLLDPLPGPPLMLPRLIDC